MYYDPDPTLTALFALVNNGQSDNVWSGGAVAENFTARRISDGNLIDCWLDEQARFMPATTSVLTNIQRRRADGK